jgi:alpha-galactosidase
MKYGDLEIWFKPLDGGDYAFCFINRGDKLVPFTQDLKTTIKKKYVINDKFGITDVWNNKDLGTTAAPLKGEVAPHDVLMLRLVKK